MAQFLNRLRAFVLNNVFAIVLIGANLIAAVSMGSLGPLMRTEAGTDTMKQAFEGVGWLTLVDFLIPIVLGTLYALPVRHPLQVRNPSELQKRRLLNAPLVMSLIGMTGWLVAIVSLFPAALTNGVALDWETFLRYSLDMLFAASMVFVITYYLLELVSRKRFVPLYFPEGRLSECEGAITLSIRARFYIYFFAAAVFPVFLFYNVFLALEPQTDPRDLAFPMTVLTAAVLLLGAFVTYLISKAYETPLSEMEHATEKIRGGDFGTKVGVVSNDEVGHLGEAINEMAVGLQERDLIKAAHERVTQELAVAWRIQREFLPDHLPHIPGWQMTATLEPAKQTSGDFYDFIPLPDGQLGLVVADVTDKGVGAALYMALSRTLLRTYAVENGTRPELAFNAAHRRILADTNTNQFVTVFYGVLDPACGTLTYSNAGHNPPYLLSASQDGAASSNGVQALENTGPPLGLRMFKDMTWEQNTVQLKAGDVLVLYSDGITEATDAREEFFEEERLLHVVQANLGSPPMKGPPATQRPSAQGIHDALLTEVHRFVGDAPQSDDITLMVLVRA
jgi:sigma-B regulation protein RsbU (phosphoserine phosphatase)